MSHTFLRWVRFGVAAALNDAVLPVNSGPRARLDVGVDVAATGRPNRVAQTKLSVFGPGDVAGIDSRQVVRTFPVANTSDFESSYYAHIEFDRPDLPWLFTPVAPDANGLLRPWLCLVLAEKREGVMLEPGTPPVLAIANGAAAELPSLSSAGTWAHVQITGDASAGPEVIARDHPERILSRMVCPRKLEPNKSYVACVVPSYNVGVEAGLGREVAKDAVLADAWTSTTDAIRLPVYYFWEFTTGGAGDFKSLVTRLKANPLGPQVGTRALDITSPGFGVADLPVPTQVALGGALRVVTPADAPIDETLAQRVLPVINDVAAVGPPIYGRWHAGATRVARGAGIPAWLAALNLDVRYRVAAGLGARIVQARQEDMMAVVWEQFGEILRANQLLRQAQVAIAASERTVNRHFAALPDAVLLGIAGPALARILSAPGKTLRREIAQSCMPLAAFSGALRRIFRAHGPIERRSARRAYTSVPDVMPAPAIDMPALMQQLADGALNARRPQTPDGAVPVPAELLSPPRKPTRGFPFNFPFRFPPGRPVPEPPEPPDGSPVLNELAGLFATLSRRDVAPRCTPLDLGTAAHAVRTAIEPDVAIPPRVLPQISLPAEQVKLTARLDPIMAAPQIPTPMVNPLMELGQDYLLPGLTQLPPNTVSLVEADAAFIEAYFVGLNHEMSRELLWRGFPTDQRGTVFANFWDRRGAVPGGNTPTAAGDITPIATWQASDALGSHLTQAASGLVVLLVRGELLQRYPRPTVYVQEARWQRDAAGAIVYDGDVARREPVPVTDTASWDRHVRFPSFSGRTGHDVLFMGFVLTRAQVRGLDRAGLANTATDAQAGWYVVFQEQPTEPRFAPPNPAFTPTTDRSETLAAGLMRPAFRLFVHGSDLVAS